MTDTQLSPAAFRERAALPGAAMPRAFSTPHQISLIDDGRGCTMPADIDRDQCAACWRPLRSGPRITPAALVTMHSGGALECVDRVHERNIHSFAGVDKPLPVGGVDDTTPLVAG